MCARVVYWKDLFDKLLFRLHINIEFLECQHQMSGVVVNLLTLLALSLECTSQ